MSSFAENLARPPTSRHALSLDTSRAKNLNASPNKRSPHG
jgi:hypothetical protein